MDGGVTIDVCGPGDQFGEMQSDYHRNNNIKDSPSMGDSYKHETPGTLYNIMF